MALIVRFLHYTELFKVTQRVGDSAGTGLGMVRGLSVTSPSFSKAYPQELSFNQGLIGTPQPLFQMVYPKCILCFMGSLFRIYKEQDGYAKVAIQHQESYQEIEFLSVLGKSFTFSKAVVSGIMPARQTTKHPSSPQLCVDVVLGMG